jgi:hypothetical protein
LQGGKASFYDEVINLPSSGFVRDQVGAALGARTKIGYDSARPFPIIAAEEGKEMLPKIEEKEFEDPRTTCMRNAWHKCSPTRD